MLEKKNGLCFAKPQHFPSGWSFSKAHWSHDDVKRLRELSGHLGLWRMVATLLLPSQSVSHHSIMLHSARSAEGLSLTLERDVLESCHIIKVAQWDCGCGRDHISTGLHILGKSS